MDRTPAKTPRGDDVPLKADHLRAWTEGTPRGLRNGPTHDCPNRTGRRCAATLPVLLLSGGRDPATPPEAGGHLVPAPTGA
jgi:alpha-beta hydrolase superfamily lysophospholipase